MGQQEEEESDVDLVAVDALTFDRNSDKYELYKSLKKKSPTRDPQVLWRLSRSAFILALAYELLECDRKQKEYTIQARDWGQAAVAADDMCAEGHEWLAISLGKMFSSGFCSSITDKVHTLLTFKRHLDKALEVKPNDANCRYVLGRCHFEVAQLSWWQKKIAELAVEKLPDGTFEQALIELHTAHRSEPGWKAPPLFLARVYIGKKLYGEAMKWVDRGIDTDNGCVLDLEGDVSLTKLFDLRKKYSKYRDK